jgi:nitroreductase
MSSAGGSRESGVDAAAVDRILSTTRAVRRRLDFERAVPHDLILDCLRLAVQAPTSGGRQRSQWIVVTDPEQRAAVACVYRDAGLGPLATAAAAAPDAATRRTYEGAIYLAENLHRVPVLVIPCIEGRLEAADNRAASSLYGSIIQAAWSFQLALRARGLGTCWTTVHLLREQEIADILGIPDGYSQITLLPVAYTVGTDFRAAARDRVEKRAHLDRWGEHPWR